MEISNLSLHHPMFGCGSLFLLSSAANGSLCDAREPSPDLDSWCLLESGSLCPKRIIINPNDYIQRFGFKWWTTTIATVIWKVIRKLDGLQDNLLSFRLTHFCGLSASPSLFPSLQLTLMFHYLFKSLTKMTTHHFLHNSHTKNTWTIPALTLLV